MLCQRVERSCYVHNIDTFNAMSKGSKDYVTLKQGTYTSFLITFLISNRFSIQKSFGKLRLRPFQPYHPILCMSKGLKVISTFDPSTCFDIHSIGWYGWKGLSLSFPKLFPD